MSTQSSESAIRAVIDTSSLVVPHLRRELQQAAQLGTFTAIWSPWIIAELNRVLVWRWINHPMPGGIVGDLSRANERRCSDAAKRMMEYLLPSFRIVTPLPPYPPVWEQLHDQWDWAAAKLGDAQYVVSENRRDYPPKDEHGKHIYEHIEFLGGDAFLAMLLDDSDK
jgi:hypothetical protein